MSLLSDDAEKWLREFIIAAISSGLQNHSEHISEDICGELMGKGWIDRARGNDGDYAWHGKVDLTAGFSKQLCGSLNIYGILRMLIADNHEKVKGFEDDICAIFNAYEGSLATDATLASLKEDIVRAGKARVADAEFDVELRFLNEEQTTLNVSISPRNKVAFAFLTGAFVEIACEKPNGAIV